MSASSKGSAREREKPKLSGAGCRQKGDRFERLTAELLEDKGYFVVRTAGSRSPADLWAMRVGSPVKFLQVKAGGKYKLDGFSPAERKALVLYALKAGAEPLLVRWYDGQREAEFSGPDAWHGNKRGTKDFLEDPESGCWIWQKASANGYGRIRRDGRTQQAHRWYYEAVNGPVASELHLDHLCCVTLCVNPDHLEPVTMSENLRRAGVKRLTDGERAAIRVSKLPNRVLAERYDVGPRQIRKIRNGR